MKDTVSEWGRVEQQAYELSAFFESHEVPERDRLPFAYYYGQAPSNALPEWTLGNFDRGILPYDSYPGYDLDMVDSLAESLIPNFKKRAYGLPAVLDVVKPVAENITESLEVGSLLASSNHPSMVSPIIVARSIIEAMQPTQPDISERIYITYGMLPAVFKYNLSGIEVSPIGIAASLGNVAVTAAISDSNMQPELREWQSIYRELYKANIAKLLAEPGNVVVTALNGQRDISFNGGLSRNGRRINQPEGGLDIFTQPNAQFINFAIYDHLLEHPTDIASPVQLYVNPRLRPITEKVLQHSNRWQAEMLDPTFDRAPYYHEGVGEMTRRVADRARTLGSVVTRKSHNDR